MGSPRLSASTVAYQRWVQSPLRRRSSSSSGTPKDELASTHSSLWRSRIAKSWSQSLPASIATRDGSPSRWRERIDRSSPRRWSTIPFTDHAGHSVGADHPFRRRCLEQLHAALDKHREELRQLVVAEVGSPVLLTYAVQVDSPIDDVPFWAELAETYEYERALADRVVFGAPQRRLVFREAAGVVGAITPWNFPLYLNMAKLSPALAAG